LAPVDPCTRTTVGEAIRVEGIDSLDLLFMIDSSPTMVDEQAQLRDQIPRLVSILTTGDLEAGTTRPGNGVQDFQPGASMHVGFLRDNSVLAVVIFTDEDDASVSNADIFDQDIPFTPNDPNVRCAFNPDYLWPIDRYVDGIRSVEPEPDRLVVISLVGVPVDL